MKGYMYALAALAFSIIWPIFGKLGFQTYNVQTVIVVWTISATIFSFLMILFSGRIKEYRILKKNWFWVLIMGLSAFLTVQISWYALTILDPGMHALISKTLILMILFTGVIFLKERFNIFEALSAALIIAGVFLVSYTNDKLIVKGVVIGIFAMVFLTVQLMLMKTKLNKLDALMVAHFRVAIIAFLSLLLALFTGQLNIFVSEGLWYITIPSLFSGVLAHIYILKSYRLIEISKSELILSSQPFMVLVLSFFIFNEFLTTVQFIGGILVVGGAIGLIYAKKLFSKKKIKT